MYVSGKCGKQVSFVYHHLFLRHWCSQLCIHLRLSLPGHIWIFCIGLPPHFKHESQKLTKLHWEPNISDLSNWILAHLLRQSKNSKFKIQIKIKLVLKQILCNFSSMQGPRFFMIFWVEGRRTFSWKSSFQVKKN